jgi:hypothetical protein
METLPNLTEILKVGLDGVLILQIWYLWKAYQGEIREHLADLRAEKEDSEKAA